MSAVTWPAKEGPVKYFDDGKWIDVTLKLKPEAILEFGRTQIKLGPGASCTHSILTNYPQVFVVNTMQESELNSGPLFSDTDQKGAEEWIRMINASRIRKAFTTKHNHPMTPLIPESYLKYVSVPTSSFVALKNNFNCSICNRKEEYGGVQCEFCPAVQICNQCHEAYEKLAPVLRKSPRHPHELFRFERAQGETFFPPDYTGAYSCDVCKDANDGPGYHCIECGNYDECLRCCAEHLPAEQYQNLPAEMKLDSRLFESAFVISPDGKTFSLKNDAKNISKCGSMITSTHWDLSKIDTEPVPHAYMEVTFMNFNASGRIGVGIGNEIHGGNQMLGYQQNSYGYMQDGSIVKNATVVGEKYLPSITAGTTIGIGVLLDSFNQRRLFFTKNGKMLEFFPGVLHRGMDVFPGVSFDRVSQVTFTVRTIAPFMFDPHSISDHRADLTNRIGSVPAELLATCLAYAAIKPAVALELRRVSKQFSEQAVSNQIWQPLFLAQWPRQSRKLKLKSWYTLFKRRYAVDASQDLSAPFMPAVPARVIENCSMEFLCPLSWDALKDSGNRNERHCDKCNKTVYRVETDDELRAHADRGHCVSLFQYADPNAPIPVPMMGMPPPMPRFIPPPLPGLAPIQHPPFTW